jgi:2-oxo-3-hexenedioate decarboxylase
MTMNSPAQLGSYLDDAAKTAKAIPQFGEGKIQNVETAYEIQRESILRRTQRGETIIGMKMGFTSRAKMVQMGVDDMICGYLTDAMMVEDGGKINLSRFVHPRVEPELAFLMKKPLRGNVTPMQAIAAVEAVAPALEIIDSRYENFKFSLTDVVADNSSSSAFVVGGWNAPGTDIRNLGMIMSFDGRPEAIGSSAAILGNPERSLVAAARLAAQYGHVIEEGSIVMAGGATAASALTAGIHVALEVEKLGQATFSVEA